MQHDVFISYSSSEFTEAGHTRRVLEENGFSCWMAPDSIPAGSDYAAEIDDAISGCTAFVLILSAKSQQSVWVPKELGMAISYGKTVLPFHIDASDIVKPFTFHLTNVQRIEAYNDLSEAYKELVHQVGAVTGKGTCGTYGAGNPAQVSTESMSGQSVDKSFNADTQHSGITSEQYSKSAEKKKKSFWGFGRNKSKSTKFIKGLTLEVESLKSRVSCAEDREALQRLYEKIRYSDPVSTDGVEGIENDITSRMSNLRSAVTNKDFNTVVRSADEIGLLIDDRNRLLRAVKK
ncbi:MAG: toll/interleukin-1 receptor domain-containing protein [Lachnospiraceae bacterium]|nr:toll/interleukin-1 receptor domain-containing protein [Lachnospiraceae bacterium]